MSAPRNIIDLMTLVIDREQFTAYDKAGVVMPVKMKFACECVRCTSSYMASLEFERVKKHPWHCKSCAISLEWTDVEYRSNHVTELLKVNGTSQARQRVSVQSRRNWNDPGVRKRMLNKDHVAIATKAVATRLANLLSGKTTYKVPHGKRVLVGTTWMRSTYEARFAHALDEHGIVWRYEPQWFSLGDKAYLPDFYVPSIDTYVEVKGWWRDDAREKFDAFVTRYPEIRYAIITITELKSIERQENALETCVIKARR